MTEIDKKEDKKTLKLNKGGTLTLDGGVSPSATDTRTKVEVKRKRKFERGSDGQLHSINNETTTTTVEEEIVVEKETSAEQVETLTKTERERREQVLKLAQENAKKEEERLLKEQQEEEKRQAELAEKQKLEELTSATQTAKVVSTEETVEKETASEVEVTTVKTKPKVEEKPKVNVAPVDDVSEKHKDNKKRPVKSFSAPETKEEALNKKPKVSQRDTAKKYGNWKNMDIYGEDERGFSDAKMRRAKEKQRKQAEAANQQKVKITREVIIPEFISVQELASRMSERAVDVIKQLMKLGVMATINQSIDADTAELVTEEMGHTSKRVSDADVEDVLIAEDVNESNLKHRAPIVTIMGHVDHGKTSLLDALRKANVAGKEAGGITQHIGAYQVKTESGQKITFIDTPGHEAFSEMRARGAQVTDIVVLIVAANDSVMPQTIEAIRHAQAAEVPIIVAINKIDLPEANSQKVKMDLLQHSVVLEEMGGDVLSVEISAKNNINLDLLLETIVLQSEVLELKADASATARGVVVESRMEIGKGSVATILVQNGTMKVGDVFVAGSQWGKVRALIDDHNKRIKKAGPSVPVEILGLQGTPAAGDEVVVVRDEAQAKKVSEYRLQKERLTKTVQNKSTLESLLDQMNAGDKEKVVLPVVIKGDVHGSIEAIIGSLGQINDEGVEIKVLHAAVGAISEADVTLANASQALIIGFNVRANPQARNAAKQEGVDINYYSIIYNVIDDVKAILSGMLSPDIKEHFIGYAKIGEVFNIPKIGKVAGCVVTEGVVKRGAAVRLLRDNIVIHEGELSQLKRFKDDAKEVREGQECGMSFANYQDLKVDDVIECFEIEEIARKL